MFVDRKCSLSSILEHADDGLAESFTLGGEDGGAPQGDAEAEEGGENGEEEAMEEAEGNGVEVSIKT